MFASTDKSTPILMEYRLVHTHSYGVQSSPHHSYGVQTSPLFHPPSFGGLNHRCLLCRSMTLSYLPEFVRAFLTQKISLWEQFCAQKRTSEISILFLRAEISIRTSPRGLRKVRNGQELVF